jgi:hypothetical protein
LIKINHSFNKKNLLIKKKFLNADKVFVYFSLKYS